MAGSLGTPPRKCKSNLIGKNRLLFAILAPISNHSWALKQMKLPKSFEKKSNKTEVT